METKLIGNKITEARRKVNLSQAQLAEQLFISPQAVGKWERGESMPDIVTLNRLAEILGVDLNYFSLNRETAITEVLPGDSWSGQGGPLSAEKPYPAKGKEKKKPGWDMSRGNWMDADFSGLKNLHEKFSSSNMLRCRFNGSDLSGLLLKNNNIDSCDFSGSDISKSRIDRSNLANNQFPDSLLKGTDFSESNIEKCNFAKADLSETKFFKSYLYGCNVNGANFTGAEFKAGGFSGIEKSGDILKNTLTDTVWNHTLFVDSHLADIVFTGTLEDCYFENCDFSRLIFKGVTLINTFFKNNSKMKRIQFIDCKADRITYEFLKQGKADLAGISLI